jgi:hypothetical protein
MDLKRDVWWELLELDNPTPLIPPPPQTHKIQILPIRV